MKQHSHDTQSDPDNGSHPNSDPEKAAILGKEHQSRTILSPEVVRVHSGTSILHHDGGGTTTSAGGKKAVNYSESGSSPTVVNNRGGGGSPRGRGPHSKTGLDHLADTTVSEHSGTSTMSSTADHRMIRVLASPTSGSTPRTEQEMHIAGGAILAADQNTSNQGENNSKSSVLSSSSSHQGALATRKRSWRITMLLFLSLLYALQKCLGLEERRTCHACLA